jgi:hypothetical protein
MAFAARFSELEGSWVNALSQAKVTDLFFYLCLSFVTKYRVDRLVP